jgi:hypothetical protein
MYSKVGSLDIDWVKDYRFILLASSNSVSQLAFYPAVAGCRQSGGWKPACIVCLECFLMLDASFDM